MLKRVFSGFTLFAAVSLWAQRPDISWMRGGHSGGVSLLAYAPDGQTLISIGEDLKVWRVSDGVLLRTIRSPFTLFFSPGSNAVSPDTGTVVSAGAGTVIAFGTADAGAAPLWTNPLATPYLAFSPSGSQIVASGAFGNAAIYFLNVTDGSIARTIPYIQFPGGVHEQAAGVVYSPDGATLAACSSDESHLLAVPSTGDGTSYFDFGVDSCAGTLVWSPDSQYVAGRGAVFALSGACPSNNPTCHPAAPVLGFTSNNTAANAFDVHQNLAHGAPATATTNSAQIYDWTGAGWSAGPVFAPSNPQDPEYMDGLASLAYSPDASTLAVGLNTAIQLWSQDGTFQRNITTDWGQVEAVAVSPDGTMAASASAANTGTDSLVNIYDMTTGRLLQSIVAAPDITDAGVFTVHFTPDNKSVVASAAFNSASATRVFSVADGSQQKSYAGVSCADLSPDGTYLVSGANVYLLSDGSLVRQGTAPPFGITCSHYSPDGQYVATATPLGVYLYRFSDMTLLRTLSSGHSYNTMAWSPDSTMIAAGGYNNGNPPVVDVWNINGTYVKGMSGATGQVRALGWSPDGGYISEGGDEPDFRIWRLSDGAVVQSYNEETGGSPAGNPSYSINLKSVTYSPDGKTIFYGRGDAAVVAMINPDWIPRATSVTVPSPVVGESSVQGTVKLEAPAPIGAVVTLTSSRPGVAHVPATVSVPVGKAVTKFSVHGGTVGIPTTATISADTWSAPVTASVTVNPAGGLWLTGVSASPASVPGGTASTGTVALNVVAPTDTTVTLSSGNILVTVPASVVVTSGASSATFPISTGAVTARTNVAIHASYNGGTVTGTLTLTITPVLQSLTLRPSSVTGGHTSTGTIRLTAAAPAGGIAVSVASDNAAASVPSMVTVNAGSTTANFTITTTAVVSPTTATITASYNGVDAPATLQVNP